MADLNTQIPIPGSLLVNPKTGLVVKAWYDFFATLFLRTGGASSDASILLDTLGDVRGGMLARYNLTWSEFVATLPNSIPVMSPNVDVELMSVLELLDLIGTTQGETLFRGAAGWELLAPGTSGYALKTQGVGADVLWAPSREVLAANRTYYVRTDGNDANNGLTNNAAGAFLTLQKAANVVYGTLDLYGFSVTIQVGAGTYTGGVTQTSPQVGAGTITFQGDVVTPANVVISTTSANCFFFSGGGTKATIQGFTLQTTTGGNCVDSELGAQVTVGAMTFGACASFHMEAANQGAITCTAAYTISGAAIRHYSVETSAMLLFVVGVTVTLTGTPAFSGQFAYSSGVSNLTVIFVTFSGAATGTRYTVQLNAIAFTNGAGVNYFPGNVAGATATGGQYA